MYLLLWIQKVIYALGGTRTVLTMSGVTTVKPLWLPLYQLVTSSPILLSRTKLNMKSSQYHEENLKLNRLKVLLSVVILAVGIINLILQITK
jgi:hypothetical protein